MSELDAQIAGLDGKQAIHYATLIARGISVPADTDEAFLALLLRDVHQHADVSGYALPADFDQRTAEAVIDSEPAGIAARHFLNTLARAPGGAEIVRAALAQPPSTVADFGIISGALALCLVWLVITGDINIKIGPVSYRKPGLKASDQVALGKAILPGMVKALPSGRGGKNV